MLRSTQLVVLFLALAAASSAVAAERCAVLSEAADGKIERVFLQSLSVASLSTDQAFALPPDAPSQVRSIQCARETLVPGTSDHKPLQAGLPLSIISGGQIGVLEAVNGQLRFRMLEGKLDDTESERVQRALNGAQERFDGRAAVAP